MKNFTFLIFFTLLIIQLKAETVSVTFQVDLMNVTISENGIYLNGSFCNWEPEQAIAMEATGTIYSATLSLETGETIQYKFVNGTSDDWGQYEIIEGLECAYGDDNNRMIVVPEKDTILEKVCFEECAACTGPEGTIAVTFQVNMRDETVSDYGVYVNGDFSYWQEPAQLNANGTIYSKTLWLTPGETITYKFLNGNPGEWLGYESPEGDCSSGDVNDRILTVPTNDTILDAYCFNSCSVCEPMEPDSVQVIFNVDMQNETISENGIYLNGSFCNWAPDQAIAMEATGTSYSATLSLAVGDTVQYKFINGVGNEWGQYEIINGLDCAYGNDANRILIVPKNNISLPNVCFATCSYCYNYNSAVDRAAAFQAAKNLDKGICYQENFVYWWSQYPDLSVFRDIANKGFKHVRMAINYTEIGGTSTDSYPYTMKSEFIESLTATVDSAIEAGLTVVLGGCDDQRMMDNPENYVDIIYAFWEQIAPVFQNRDNEKLLFELSNEPRSNMTADKWNSFFPNIIDIIRETNSDRMLVVQPANYTMIDAATELILPDDPNLIMSFHFYDPASVIGENAPDGSVWTNDFYEVQHLRSILQVYKALADSLNIPLWYGEGGADKDAPDDTRSNWAQTFSNICKEYDTGMAYFDYSSDNDDGTGMYNKDYNTWNDHLVSAYLAEDLPEEQDNHTILWSQSFETKMGDCSIYTSKPADEVSYGIENGKLYITTTTSSGNASDIQLNIPAYNFSKGHYYAIDFTAHTSKGFAPFTLNYNALWAMSAFTPSEIEYSRVFWANESGLNYMSIPLGNISDTVFFKDISIIEISPVLAQSISINEPSNTNPVANDSIQLSVTVLPESASEKSAQWTVVEGTNIANISREGLLVVTGNGTIAVEAKAQDGTELTDTLYFNVSDDNIVDVTFQVDMSGTDLTGSVNMYGSWNYWQTPTELTSEGTVYSTIIQMQVGEEIQYKFVNDGVYETIIGDCTYEQTGNRYLLVPAIDTVLGVVCFASCEACIVESAELIELQNIQLYPNPTNKSITLSGLPLTEVELDLFTLEGKTCLQKTIHQGGTATIDVTKLTSGFYFISIKNQSEIKTFKFIKQ